MSLDVDPLALPDDAGLRARVDALADEAWPIRFSERERAAALAGEALRLAQEVHYPVGVALALRTLAAQQFYFHSDYDGAEPRLRRALELLEGAGETRGKADLLNALGTVERRRSRQSEALRLHLSQARRPQPRQRVIGRPARVAPDIS